MGMVDIYFDPNYGKLYEQIEKGICEVYEHKSDSGRIHYMFIKRQIPTIVDDITWYDLVTPYGYGGPIIINCKLGKKDELINEFYKSFKKYCTDNNIVSEFIRFHPILKNHKDFKEIYDVQYVRKTLGTNLRDFDDPFQSEFSKSCRKTVRRALRNGVTFEIEESPSNINEFIDIYNSTMDRNEAGDYYYFGGKYFDDIINNLKSNVIIVRALFKGRVIASGLYFIFNKTIHIHLSGTLDEYLDFSPAYILKYAVMLWGKENGYELIHHGGGRSNSVEDLLYRFKKKFARNTEFDFCVGKRIWNMGIYNKLCGLKGVNRNIEFFPAYRFKV